MHTVLLLLTFLAATVATPLHAQNVTAHRVQAHVEYLADDAREGRGVGSEGLDSAAAYIAWEFARLGLTQPWSDGFFQRFEISPTATAALAHTGLAGASVKNVVGILPGRGKLAGQVIVVGAHYDHLGLGGMGSLDPDSTGVVHNGADDNGSGAAALIEIARLVRARASGERRTIVFVAFTAEEIGVVGSTHYVRQPVRPNDSTAAMINLDMVGRLRDGKLLAFGTETALDWDHLLDSLNAEYEFDLHGSGDGWGRSDHQSFYAVGIPVLHLFTDTHEDYHRVTDDADKINSAGVARIARFAADLVWALATRAARLTHVSLPRPEPIAGGSQASLGTIPDMTESPGGVRLTGVRAGTPAETAGIQAGDIITRIGEHEVNDLYAMSRALAAYEPSDVVTVVIKRGNRMLEFEVTLGRRGG